MYKLVIYSIFHLYVYVFGKKKTQYKINSKSTKLQCLSKCLLPKIHSESKTKYTEFLFRYFSFYMSFGIVIRSPKTFLQRTQDVVYFASYKTKIYGIFRICPYIRIFFRICTTMSQISSILLQA